MANEDKEKKKADAAVDRERRLAGVIPRAPNFTLDAGRRVETAWAWIPRLKWIIVSAFVVSALCFLGVVYAVYSRPAPMVFLSLPDGTIACGPTSDATGKVIPRSRSHQALCDRLRPPTGFENTTTDAIQPQPAAAPAGTPEPAAPVSPGVAETPPAAPGAPSVVAEAPPSPPSPASGTN